MHGALGKPPLATTGTYAMQSPSSVHTEHAVSTVVLIIERPHVAVAFQGSSTCLHMC